MVRQGIEKGFFKIFQIRFVTVCLLRAFTLQGLVYLSSFRIYHRTGEYLNLIGQNALIIIIIFYSDYYSSSGTWSDCKIISAHY